VHTSRELAQNGIALWTANAGESESPKAAHGLLGQHACACTFLQRLHSGSRPAPAEASRVRAATEALRARAAAEARRARAAAAFLVTRTPTAADRDSSPATRAGRRRLEAVSAGAALHCHPVARRTSIARPTAERRSAFRALAGAHVALAVRVTASAVSRSHAALVTASPKAAIATTTAQRTMPARMAPVLRKRA